MEERVLSNPKIQVHFNTVTEEILGEEEVTGARFRNTVSGHTFELPVNGFFVAIGHQPNSGIFKGWLDMDDNGYLKTVPGTAKTNIEGVFAGGDVQDHVYRQAVTAAGTGCMAALEAERYLTEKGLN